MKSFVNKFIYFRYCRNYSYTKEDIVFNARNIGYMQYCHQNDQTMISFTYNRNYDKMIEMKGKSVWTHWQAKIPNTARAGMDIHK